MLNFLSRKHREAGTNGLLMVVFNSCSPSKEISTYLKTELDNLTDQEDILSTRRKSQIDKMIENIKYRNICYWKGRSNFSNIRGTIPWITRSKLSTDYPTTAVILPNPLLPHWESGNAQFTRIDKEDRYYTHVFIGKLIAMEREHRLKELEKGNQNPQSLYFSTPELFFALFTVASCDRRGTIMIHLRNDLGGLFGVNWWNYHVNQWQQLARIQFAPIWSGGSKKKRKKKRKTRKRRKIRRKKLTRRRKRKKRTKRTKQN
jgi:hypothetical protein